jgi:hypothetical protein
MPWMFFRGKYLVVGLLVVVLFIHLPCLDLLDDYHAPILDLHRCAVSVWAHKANALLILVSVTPCYIGGPTQLK